MPQADGAGALRTEAEEGFHPADALPDGEDQRGDEGKAQEVTEHAVVETDAAGGQVAGMMVAIDAGGRLFEGMFVSMERGREERRQENRQQQNRNNASLQIHSGTKIDISPEMYSHYFWFSGE